MKKYIILALLLLPMLAFSQMQNIMNQNSTATLKRNTSYTTNNISYDSIKIRTIDKNNLLNFIKEKNHILHNLFCEIEDDIYVIRYDDEIEPYLHINGGNLHFGNSRKDSRKVYLMRRSALNKGLCALQTE